MGNTNNTSGPTGERHKQRRPSTAEAGPLEVPFGTQRYNVGNTPPNSSQTLFSKNLVEQINVDPEQEFLKQNFHHDDMYTRRYRAGSISVDMTPPAPPPPPSPPVKRMPAVIKWDKDGKEVAVTGSFNNWEKKIPLVRSEKNFYTIVEVSEGEHQYKFYVDGQWRHNPDEPSVKNTMGSFNNVLKVSKDDFEFLQALETDREATSISKKTSEVYPENVNRPTTPVTAQEEYGQEIPSVKSVDRTAGPPVLPPHLLQIILNKDVPEHLEPGILPEPNHVMLNHLYALSIKDGVMVLSDTSRYKKKYVTTLLYKPIDG